MSLKLLSEQDKTWLESYSKAHKISVAEAIRQGIRILRKAESQDTYRAIVKNTRGIWQRGDGLVYKEEIRAEWQ